MPRLCGWKCSGPGCSNSWDFTCDKCDQAVCRLHFKYELHQCPHHKEGDPRVVLCPCCDKAVHVNVGENAKQGLVNHMESQECQREGALRIVDRSRHICDQGILVCFPFSVHKLLGNSHEKAKKRLEAMTHGMYGFADIKAALLGTDVKIVQLDLEFPVFSKSLEPGSYVFGQRGHMVGVRIFHDRSVVVHDNMSCSGVGSFGPTRYYRAWKVSFEGDIPTRAAREVVSGSAFKQAELQDMKMSQLRKLAVERGVAEHSLDEADDAEDSKSALVALVLATVPPAHHTLSTDIRPHSEWNANQQQEQQQQQQRCLPWSACKWLRQSNMDAQRQLKEIRDVKAALEGTGMKLVKLQLQQSLLPQSLPEGSYILGRKGHLIGVCVSEDGGLQVYDNTDIDLGEFCLAGGCCAWKLSSSQ